MAIAEWQGPPESHPLASARGKLVRAMQQARHLCDHCKTYADSEPVRLVSRRDGEVHLVFAEGTWPPMYLGLILGEVVHELRCALDHVAWQLAADHTDLEAISRPNVAPAIQFPITATSAKFESHRAIKYFSAEAAAIMERLQPYHNDDSRAMHPLALVQRLSNTDKHQVLTPFLGQLRVEDMHIRFKDVPKLRPWVPVPGQVQIEPASPAATLVNDASSILRVRTPPHVAIWLDPPPIHVSFLTDLPGEKTVILAQTVPQLCTLIAEALEPFLALFPSFDWTTRTASWTTPNAEH